MMKKFLFLCLIFLMAAPAFAIDLKDVELGGKVQLRGYDMNNFWNFDDDNDIDNWSVFRSYTSLQTKLKLSDDVAGFVKLTNQTWGSGVGVNANGEGENMDDGVFADNAYMDLNNIWCSPVSLRIGRQNVQYGTGFVLFDGQSQFGSTSLYFDGIKGSLKFNDNAILDAFYLKDQENVRWDDPTDDDINLYGLYFTGKCPVMGGQQEVYLLDRDDQSLDKNIMMAGLRLSDKYDIGLDYSAEAAYQFGKFKDNETADIDKDALGCKLDGGFTITEAPLTPRLFLGYTFLEGDDPDTKDNERWDVFYGGWPQWGDLLAWKYLNNPNNTSIKDYDTNFTEGSSTPGEACYSNLHMATAGVGFKFPLNISANLSYSLLTADEARDPVTLKHEDDDIGDYYQLTTKYSYSPNVDFSIYSAILDPGDAFIGDDMAYEVFAETALKF